MLPAGQPSRLKLSNRSSAVVEVPECKLHPSSTLVDDGINLTDRSNGVVVASVLARVCCLLLVLICDWINYKMENLGRIIGGLLRRSANWDVGGNTPPLPGSSHLLKGQITPAWRGRTTQSEQLSFDC